MKRLNLNINRLAKSTAYGIVGVLAHSFINKYVEKDTYKWVIYVVLVMLGISTPLAIALISKFYPEGE